MKKWIATGLTVILAAGLAGCGNNAKGTNTITVGSKNFTENIILAHMMADIIEQETDLKVKRKVNLGGSNVAWKALQKGDIQLYPDYTGTIVSNYYQEETGSSDDTLAKTQELLKKDNFVFPNRLGINNTYTLAVPRKIAEQYNLRTFSDLAKVADKLVLGCEFEFKDRPDGFPGLKTAYNMNFKDVVGMDHGIMYRSLKEGNVDVIDAFATDGQIKVNDLVVLEDDKGFFPPYDGGPLIRQDTLDKHPEIADALAKLEGILTDEEMQTLNAKTDSEGLKEENVARDFLKEKGVLK